MLHCGLRVRWKVASDLRFRAANRRFLRPKPLSFCGISGDLAPSTRRSLNGGGFKRGGFPDLDLSFLFCPFLSFLGLSRFFWDFPELLRDGPGIFPICPFPLSRTIKSTYEEQSRKGPRHNLDLSQKSGKHPGLEPPRLSFSQSEKN